MARRSAVVNLISRASFGSANSTVPFGYGLAGEAGQVERVPDQFGFVLGLVHLELLA